MLSAPTDKNNNAYFCPWGQTLPFVTRNNLQLEAHKDKFLDPLIEFRKGDTHVMRELTTYLKYKFPHLKSMIIKRAIDKAYNAFYSFRSRMKESFNKAFEMIQAEGREARGGRCDWRRRFL